MNCINYQFTSMPNGYGPAMKIFTTLKHHRPVIYLNDSYICNDMPKSYASTMPWIKLQHPGTCKVNHCIHNKSLST